MEEDIIGCAVIDPEGVELGFIEAIEDEYYMVGEGVTDTFMIHKSLIRERRGKNLVLKNNLYDMLYESKVFDSQGKRIGTVVEIIESGDVIDTIIIDQLEKGEDNPMGDGEDRYLYVLLEEIGVIEPDTILLKANYEDLKFHNHPHTIRESIWDKVKHIFKG